ncbi:MAG: zinc-dependent peptidase [Cytophagaceae bacterium]
MSSIDIEYLLQKDFSYYRKLPPESRPLFKQRISEFIKHTEFQGRQGLEVTDTMKILVAATAAQLTFGFNSDYNYDHFSKIILYPDRYVSKYTGQLHVGEMNTGGVIVFSWKDFYEGIKTDNDSRNVGLHEFAHALDFIDKAELGINDYFAHTIDKIKVFGRHYIHKKPEKPFFRSYAATNSTEFFAVGTEYFFEAPIEFRKEMPELYNLYCIAYRQQPQPKVVLPVKTHLVDNHLGGDEGVYSSSQLLGSIGLVSVILIQLLWWVVAPFLWQKEVDSYNAYFVIGTLFSGALCINYGFRGGLGFFRHHVRIYYPLWKAFFRCLLFQKHIFYSSVRLEEVLLIHIKEVENESVTYVIDCTFLYQNKLKEATWRTDSLMFLDSQFSYYYNEYKIAFREDGAVKKYEIK